LTLVGVGVLLLGASVLMRAQGPPTSATMTLAMSNGACAKTLVGNDGGDRIRASRNGPIRWAVINNCNAAATVQLTNFVRKSDNSPNFPFAPNGNDDCRAAGGGGTCTMTLVVRGNAEVTTYSYTTVINGVAYDPDIIIEQ
jgi:hypothetical protein